MSALPSRYKKIEAKIGDRIAFEVIETGFWNLTNNRTVPELVDYQIDKPTFNIIIRKN
jgi:hypothetical protein